MPAYRDVAQMLVAGTVSEHARIPFDASVASAPVGLEMVYGFPPRAVENGADIVGSAGRTLPTWRSLIGGGVSSGAIMVLPFRFEYDGTLVDAEDEVRALPAGVQDAPAKFRVSIEDGLGASDLVATLEGLSAHVPDTADNRVYIATAYADNQTVGAGSMTDLASLPVKVEVETGDPAAYGEFLPLTPVLTPVDFWCTAGESAADFAALAVTAEGLDTIAKRTLTLEAAYDARLEDLDTRVQYGTDSAGAPIRWRITTTSRNVDRSLSLNLEAFLR
ncbi:MAG: hypothetical protein OXI22_08010 [Defluviicoccus sp.]|nr:hypothetical protein [Defluviicoccus sp.]